MYWVMTVCGWVEWMTAVPRERTEHWLKALALSVTSCQSKHKWGITHCVMQEKDKPFKEKYVGCAKRKETESYKNVQFKLVKAENGTRGTMLTLNLKS